VLFYLADSQISLLSGWFKLFYLYYGKIFGKWRATHDWHMIIILNLMKRELLNSVINNIIATAS
jgi:hypothetical protein